MGILSFDFGVRRHVRRVGQSALRPSMVRVVMDIFINQSASKLFIDFLLCFC